MLEIKGDRLKYYLIPGKSFPGDPFMGPRNQIFEFWKNHWSQIYLSAGSINVFPQDDFFRQDWVSSLFYESRPIATLLFTHFILDSQPDRQHNYLKFYTDPFFDYLRENKVESVMSFEYFLVNQDWSRKLPGVGIGELLITLGIEVFERQKVSQACIATVRTDVAAALQAHRCGFNSIVPNLSKRNFPVDLMACLLGRSIESSNQNLIALKTYLWENRVSPFETNVVPFKKAA